MARSLSSRSWKVWPQKRGSTFGKQIETSTWFSSMDARRSFWIQPAGWISSNVTGVMSRSSKPAAAETFGNG